ncbi:hypothetical protein POJ06DRAFT_249394, partial [Lipomyces tetrasporus]
YTDYAPYPPNPPIRLQPWGFTNPDYLAIPASEVATYRLYNSGTDLLGLRRHSLIRTP